jgi:hypothetical protein
MKPIAAVAALCLFTAPTMFAQEGDASLALKGKWLVKIDVAANKQTTEELDVTDVKGGKIKARLGKKAIEGQLAGTILTLKDGEREFSIYLDGLKTPVMGLGSTDGKNVSVRLERKAARPAKMDDRPPPNKDAIDGIVEKEFVQGKSRFTVESVNDKGIARGKFGATTPWAGTLSGNLLVFNVEFTQITRMVTVVFAKDGDDWAMMMKISTPK